MYLQYHIDVQLSEDSLFLFQEDDYFMKEMAQLSKTKGREK